jgi:hypothetical protein
LDFHLDFFKGAGNRKILMVMEIVLNRLFRFESRGDVIARSLSLDGLSAHNSIAPPGERGFFLQDESDALVKVTIDLTNETGLLRE